MEIKLDEFIKNTDPTKSSTLGHARVNLNEKMFVYVTVLTGQKGIFVKFPSVKLNGEFRPALGWPSQNIESKIREAIMPEIHKRLENVQAVPF